MDSSPLNSTSLRVGAQARASAKQVRRSGRALSAGTIDVGYARISDDEKEEQAQGKRVAKGKGVKRQRADGDAKAREHGLGPLRWYVDNDISGGDFTNRARYDAMLLAIEAGEVRTVVAYSLDRIGREDVEQAEFLLICEVYGVRVITCEGDDIDHRSEDADGAVAMASMRNTFAVLERKKIRRRVARKHQELADEGKPHGGGRTFGFEPDGVTHRPEEVELIRAAADAVEAGAGATTIARQWRADEVPTARGGQWSPRTVRVMLTSPRVIGMRSHHGETVRAVWDPILTAEQQARVRARLAGRPVGPRPQVAMLAGGLVRCEVCETPLSTAVRASGKRIYRCWGGRGGCGKVSVLAEPVEDIVTRAFFCRLDLLYAAARRRQMDPSDRRAKAVVAVTTAQAKLDELAELFGEGLLTKDRYRTQHDKANKRLKAAQQALAEIPDASAVTDLVAAREQLRRDWDSTAPSARRATLCLVIDYVPISPAQQPYREFSRDRVRDPLWRV